MSSPRHRPEYCMPFTPFHMGIGLAIKPLAGRHFSVLTFGVAQVAMDIEPLIGMLHGSAVLHGPSHTYLGAIGIGLLVALLARWICPPMLRRWNTEILHYRLAWLHESGNWTTRTFLLSALAGTLSHVVLDSVMHLDMAPWAPWSKANGLYSAVSLSFLHWACTVGIFAGSMGWIAMKWFRRSSDVTA